MPQYLTNDEEKQIRKLLDELADEWGLYCPKTESYFSGFYLDRLWYKTLEEKRIPFVAFEIEKGIPNNERIRKDIMNVAWSNAPVGYIIVPHKRVLFDPLVERGSTGQYWYKNRFYKAFQEYRKPFVFYCDIQLVDADELLLSRSLKAATIDGESI